jgi:predicted Zn-dependent protease
VLDGGGKAMAEGTRVIFGRGFPGFSYPEPEFAAAVAHELAHNLLRHRALLDEKGRSLGNVRLSEREADRLMPWLLANAGFAPAAAVRFMERWGPRHGGGLFRARTHEGWDERADAIRAEVVKVEALMASEGRADWARHFERETLVDRK